MDAIAIVMIALGSGIFGFSLGIILDRRRRQGAVYRRGYGHGVEYGREQNRLARERELRDARRSHAPRPDAIGNARQSQLRITQRNG